MLNEQVPTLVLQFENTRDGLCTADRQLEDGNLRVSWAEHQTSAGPKRDISCLFSVCSIYWRRVSAARVYGSLIRPVGPNRTGWTQTHMAIG